MGQSMSGSLGNHIVRPVRRQGRCECHGCTDRRTPRDALRERRLPLARAGGAVLARLRPGPATRRSTPWWKAPASWSSPTARPTSSRAGDVVVLPRGDSHVIRSGRGRRSRGARTAGVLGCTILCGAFVVRDSEHPVLRALPHVIRIPTAEAPSVGSLIDALGAEARSSSPGGEVVMARLSDALVVQALRHHAQAGRRRGLARGAARPAHRAGPRRRPRRSGSSVDSGRARRRSRGSRGRPSPPGSQPRWGNPRCAT